jgi:hypothetical protein
MEGVSGDTSELFGSLIWKHVGLCSVSGPHEKQVEIRIPLSKSGSLSRATIRLDGGQCESRFGLYGPPRTGCGDRGALFPDLAQRFNMPLLGTPKEWRLRWETPRVSVVGTTHYDGSMLDIINR